MTQDDLDSENFGCEYGGGIFTCHSCREKEPKAESDAVNHPPHYTAHPSGVECITITQHMNFCLGNAVKYIWRSGLKALPQQEEGPDPRIQDLEKARWYLTCEIRRLRGQTNEDQHGDK